MKYIRTKDERILEFSKLNEVSKLSIDMAGEPIRESDTIEELCDWYIGIDTFGKAHFMETTIPFENVKLCFKGMEIYAAILTSKGLIYKAKMNGKGDLELL